MNKKAEALADLIEANPHCEFLIDNDGWSIRKPQDEAEDFDEDETYDNRIADSSDYDWNTEWYSSSAHYGSGLAEAMVILLNRRGFNIEASAV